MRVADSNYSLFTFVLSIEAFDQSPFSFDARMAQINHRSNRGILHWLFEVYITDPDFVVLKLCILVRYIAFMTINKLRCFVTPLKAPLRDLALLISEGPRIVHLHHPLISQNSTD